MTLVIAAINFLMCAIRLYVVLRAKRLISIVWFLITYFSMWYIIVATQGSFTRFREFSGLRLQITDNTIYQLGVYMLIFNFIFLCAERFFWEITGRPQANTSWYLHKNDSRANKIIFSFFIMIFLGSIFYWSTVSGHGYRDYVEYQGSNWGLVFVWASAPAIVIATLQKRYLVAIAFNIPFFIFAVQLNIRSFFILSLIPMVVVFFFQLTQSGNIKKKFMYFKRLVGVAGMLVILILASAFVQVNKSGRMSFPDMGLPFGCAVIFEAVKESGEQTGFNSLKLYGANIVNPFMRLFNIPQLDIDDTPVIMARLYDGIPERVSVYYHYPVLWYADAFLSFEYKGLFLAVLWAFIICLWEALMSKRVYILALTLPCFCWHAYMLVRGAIAVSTVQFAYALYFSFIVAFLFCGFSLFRKNQKVIAN